MADGDDIMNHLRILDMKSVVKIAVYPGGDKILFEDNVIGKFQCLPIFGYEHQAMVHYCFLFYLLNSIMTWCKYANDFESVYVYIIITCCVHV